MAQAYLSRQRLRSLKVVDLLEGSCLILEGISALGGVREVESMHAIIRRVFEVVDGIFEPVLLSRHALAHVIIHAQHDVDLG